MDSQETLNQVPVLETKADVIARVKQLAQDAASADKQELDSLKLTFYKLHKAQQEAERTAYIEAGGAPETYVPAPNDDEAEYKAAMAVIKEARFAHYQEQELLKQQNYVKCLAIIDRLKALLEKPEEASSSYNDFKQIMHDWQEAKPLPADKANEMWKSYQLYREQFYDILKINSEFREYDFKKNLEAKTRLCEAAEKLVENTDAIASFHKLQDLHLQYREIGPVAKELREEIWNRFKAASTIINKRHQDHFEQKKEQENKNLELKTALCERVEAIVLDEITTAQQWNEKSQFIIDTQKEWKTIGFAPQKMNQAIFDRFRAACDRFFTAKADHYKQMKNDLQENLKKKTALCEKAEAVMDSTDWAATTTLLVNLQKEWKTIGPAPKKVSDAVWERFTKACDHFFESKGKANSSQAEEQGKNLETKRAIIASLQAIRESEEEKDEKAVRDLVAQWNSTGHVPFKEKDTLYTAYREVVDALFKELNLSSARRRLDNFKSSLKDNNPQAERSRLVRRFEAMKNDIQTYENNLGFISSSTKKGNSLAAEMQRKVERLKDELELLRQKIAAIDEQA